MTRYEVSVQALRLHLKRCCCRYHRQRLGRMYLSNPLKNMKLHIIQYAIIFFSFLLQSNPAKKWLILFFPQALFLYVCLPYLLVFDCSLCMGIIVRKFKENTHLSFISSYSIMSITDSRQKKKLV